MNIGKKWLKLDESTSQNFHFKVLQDLNDHSLMTSTHTETRGYALKTITCLQIDRTNLLQVF